jgi:hypothetical protein
VNFLTTLQLVSDPDPDLKIKYTDQDPLNDTHMSPQYQDLLYKGQIITDATEQQTFSCTYSSSVGFYSFHRRHRVQQCRTRSFSHGKPVASYEIETKIKLLFTT